MGDDDSKVKPSAMGIVVGGRPAPGVNGIIGAATIEAVNSGLRVLGIYDGFQHLAGESFDPDDDVRLLTIKDVERVHFDGGSILRASPTSLLDDSKLRVSPLVEPGIERVTRVWQRLQALGVTRLLTIGGDDTALNARFISTHAGGALRIVHVPSTIDNDLPLPGGAPTAGFATARHVGSQIVANLMEDSRTTSRWYIIVTMGRNTGHLALGIGKSSGATLTVIPEEFSQPTTISEIVDILEGAMLKRRASGRRDGVAILAEGLATILRDPDELPRSLGRPIPRDAAGHPRLSEVPVARILQLELERRFAARDERMTIVAHTLGYELRCAAPTASDMAYARDLGHGGVQLLLDSLRELPPGVMITLREGNLHPVAFDDMIDPLTNRTRIRLVDTESYSYRVARAYMIRLEQGDFESPTMLTALASEAQLTPRQFRQRYGPLTNGQRTIQ